MVKVEAKDLNYGGKYYSIVIEISKKFFTTLEAQIEYILANCTLLVFALAKINGLPLIANSIPNANQLHTRVANGWEAIKYTSGMQLLPNDVVEWSCNHVAYITGTGTNPKLYASWWTNYNGTSKGRRSDTKLTSTLEATINYFYTKYVYRFFHETTFEDECARGGGGVKPTYVLRCKTQSYPVVESVARDTSKNQIIVYTNEQNMRDNPNGNVVGISQKGYYDVLSTKTTDFTWYEVKKNVWVAGVNGRVEYLPKQATTTIDYEKKYNDLKSKVNKLAKEIVELTK